jgi:lysozyme
VIPKTKPWLKVTGGGALAIAVALAGYFEGEQLTAYHDPGNGTPTLCDGETHGVFMGMTATHEECQAWLAKGMQQRIDFINSHMVDHQPETRQAALADFVYNEGEGTFLKSSIFRDINNGHIQKGCDELHLYNIAGGKILPGLAARREAEYQLCIEGLPNANSH